MTETNDNLMRTSRSISRKRYKVLEGNSISHFNLYQPFLNLNEEQYNKRLEEIKKMGNMG
ncbi:MAG: hypothetical protein Q7J85_14040 [Bacillota bacterium]|nr:hypothetical protein [Bacillota bacterium]